MRFPEYARAIGRKWSGRRAALVILREATSTHLLAKRIVEEYAAESDEAPPSDFLAWHETAGRGGLSGSDGSSPPGAGVYSTLIRVLARSSLQTLPLVVAVALCQALNRQLAGRCRIKWPNDLWVGHRKLGELLIDATCRAQGDGEGVVLISFGVNHDRGLDQADVTSMATETEDAAPLPDLAAQLVAAIDDALTQPSSIEELAARYQELSTHRPGDAMRFQVGEEQIEGVFAGFDDHGFLRLGVAGEERLLSAEEVILAADRAGD